MSKHYVCEVCGGDHLEWSATVYWSRKEQAMIIDEVGESDNYAYGLVYCYDCQDDVEVIELLGE